MRLILVLVLLAFPISALAEEKTEDAPCSSPLHHALDFWLGSWDVYARDTDSEWLQAGRNHISRVQDGCVIHEQYEAARDRSSYSGQSLNFVNPTTGNWQQTWVDSDGGVILYAADTPLDSGGLRFRGTHFSPGEPPVLSRMLIEPRPGDRVRQLIEQSNDNGESWEVWFEGTYVRGSETP